MKIVNSEERRENKQIIETLNKMFIKWLYYLWILHERDDV